MSNNRLGYRGYVSSRGFGGTYIPVPLQSLALRDYCARNKLMYKLHVNENMFPHSYMVLEGLVQNLDGLEGIVMCSMFMLPERAERRAKIYHHIFRQSVDLRFVMEDVIIAKPEDVEPVEEILSIYNTLQHCPTAVPDEAAQA
jgi:sporadic carbohydrate cluster protein (TIGR04323 family)